MRDYGKHEPPVVEMLEESNDTGSSVKEPNSELSGLSVKTRRTKSKRKKVDNKSMVKAQATPKHQTVHDKLKRPVMLMSPEKASSASFITPVRRSKQDRQRHSIVE